MDYSFRNEVEYNGRRYTVLRLARRPRDPRDDEVRDYMGRRIRYEYILPGPGPAPAPAAKRARVAASAEAIDRLLREVKARDVAPQTECAVCLQDYAAAEEEEEATAIRAMPVCNHAFHHRCISEWLTRNPVCPICRRELPLPTEHEDDDDEEDEYGIRRSWNWIRVPVSAPAGRNW